MKGITGLSKCLNILIEIVLAFFSVVASSQISPLFYGHKDTFFLFVNKKFTKKILLVA